MKTPENSADAGVTVEPPKEVPTWRVLYLFAGPERHADIKFFLEKLAHQEGAVLQMEEWDILRDPSHDLTCDNNWQTVLDRIAGGSFDFIIAAPPATLSAGQDTTENTWDPDPLGPSNSSEAFLG